MAEPVQPILKTERKNEMLYTDKMLYTERLANYEREKMLLPRMAGDSKTYEAALKALARKWRV